MIEGYDCLEEEDLTLFIKRVKEIVGTGMSKPRGASSRYGLTIGIRNHRAVLAPTVTTHTGVTTLIAWNLTTENIKKIKETAHEIDVTPVICPFLWEVIPAVLPSEIPPESLENAKIKEEKK